MKIRGFQGIERNKCFFLPISFPPIKTLKQRNELSFPPVKTLNQEREKYILKIFFSFYSISPSQVENCALDNEVDSH